MTISYRKLLRALKKNPETFFFSNLQNQRATMLTVILACILVLWWLVSKGIQGVHAFLPSTPELQSNPLADAPHPTIHHAIANDPEVPSPEPRIYHHSFDYPLIRGSLRLILHNSPNNPIGYLSIGSNIIPELCWKRWDEWLCALNLTTRKAFEV